MLLEEVEIKGFGLLHECDVSFVNIKPWTILVRPMVKLAFDQLTMPDVVSSAPIISGS